MTHFKAVSPVGRGAERARPFDKQRAGFLYTMSPEPCIPIQPLQFIVNIKKEARINYGLVNGFSSGGTFISIVLKRIDI